MAKVVQKVNGLEVRYLEAKKNILRAYMYPLSFIILGVILGIISGINYETFSSSETIKVQNVISTVGTVGWVLCGSGFISLVVIGIIMKLKYPDFESLKYGVQGEKKALKILSRLSDDFTVIPDLNVQSESGSSQLDFLVIHPKGVWIVENKNMNGTIVGDEMANQWIQKKVGEGGTQYEKAFYSPMKQVKTHVFRMKQYLQEHKIGNLPWIQGVVFFSNPKAIINVESTEKHPIFHYEDELIEYLINQSETNRNNSVDVQRIVELCSSL